MVLKRLEELNKADDDTREIRGTFYLMTCKSIAAFLRTHALVANSIIAREVARLDKEHRRQASRIFSHQIDTHHGTNWLDVSNRHAVTWEHFDHHICHEAQDGKIDIDNRESSSYPI
jgi:hypothetical protein